MSGTKSDKPPRIKGLVKRCRSFKEDILSRLARNRSLGSESPGNAPGAASPTGWNNNSDLLPGEVPNVEPHVSISHRLKEAHLTLQFVESLIQKNCIDLLGGSSNVMLDLMGCLLNDIKKASASDSAAYQSGISQVKAALSDFLTSVDALLLKDHYDDAQRELYVEKLLGSLKTTREALARLKNLIDAKENNSHGSSKLPPVNSTPKKTQSTPGVNTDSTRSLSVLTSNQSNVSSGDLKNDWGSEPVVKSEEKKPPLPPKLKQWTAKSFDMIDWSPRPSSPSNAPPSRNSSQVHLSGGRGLPYHEAMEQNHNSANSTSLLNQWLEQSSSLSGIRPESPLRHSGASNSTSQLSPRSSQTHQSLGLSNLNCSSSGSLLQHQVYQHKEHHHSSKLFELSTTSSPHSQSQNWIDSAIYTGRSSTSSACGNATAAAATSRILQINGKKTRTFSDSYRLGSEDSLDKMLLVDESRSQSAATTHSQSLSLGSSLDNLLLVDAQSQQSGLSPNSNSGGAGGANRISVSSCNTNSATGLAGLSTYDPDTDTDADVFLTEVSSCSARGRPRSRENVSPSAIQEEGSPPPALPEKQCKNRISMARSSDFSLAAPPRDYSHSPRCPSPYDNVKEGEEIDVASWHGTGSLSPVASACSRPSFSGSIQHRPFMSYSESRNTLVGASCGQDEEKPPLPPKKKHSLITAYVELLHNFDSHAYHLHHQQHHHHHHHHFQNHQNSFHYQHHHSDTGTHHQPLTHQYSHQIPLQSSYHSNNSCHNNEASPTGVSQTELKRAAFANSYGATTTPSITRTGTTPLSPDDNFSVNDNQLFVSPTTSSLSPSSSFDAKYGQGPSSNKPPALPPKKSRANFLRSSLSEQGEPGLHAVRQVSPPNSLNTLNIPGGISASTSPAPALTPAHSFSGADSVSLGSPQRSLDDENVDIYILDAGPLLVMNDGSTTIGKPSCDGPEVKGGEPHVLIVYAASPNLTDKKFREVFLLTYRNFVRPLDVISLLWKRYQYFEKKTDRTSVVHARATLDLFVDVVNSLTPMDLDDPMIEKVRDCVYYLVGNGEIMNALKARKGLISKYSVRVKLLCPKPAPASLAVTAEGQTLLQWSATSIAQQMTLLDSDLFRQLEPAELLLWAREQTEDLCPALNNFTEHFNKVSYWARSKVLTCVTSRERNRTMKKLIEVMRKLREYSNFNSLLAVLAALDSAPIRRLGFSRRLTEALKPHAALTDSSGSFRTYRLALAESKPPCIPYLGLVLQDLTFVHIGNVDFLTDGKVNWIKRWQQWVVLEPIRRFHACQYGFIRNDSLLSFLNNFDESLNDDDLWQLSEQIKPRTKNN